MLVASGWWQDSKATPISCKQLFSLVALSWATTEYEKGFWLTIHRINSFTRALNFEGHAADGSYLMIINPNIRHIRYFNKFLIYETVNVHDNLHSYGSMSILTTYIH